MFYLQKYGWFANKSWDFNYGSRNSDSNGKEMKEAALDQENWNN